MFPADSLHPQYFEEQAAKFAAKRPSAPMTAVAHHFRQPASAASSPPTTRPSTPSLQIPASAQNYPQRPTLSRPNSSSLLGGIFQGFVRAASVPPGEMRSRSAPTTPVVEKTEKDALIAEKKRDADICAMPAW